MLWLTKEKNGLKLTAAILVSALLFFLVLALFERPDNYPGTNPMMKKEDCPILIAHGGGNGEFPDNTLEAFYNAYSVDKNVMMETDVSITKDGVVILSHDTTIDRKTNETGEISEWNYSDLMSEEVDFGYDNNKNREPDENGNIPYLNGEGKRVTPLDVEYPEGVSARHETKFLATTLEELITHFPKNRINVEIKQDGEVGIKALREVLRLVEKYDAYEIIVLASFHSDIYSELVRISESGEVPESFMFSPAIVGVVKYYLLHTLALDVFFTDGIAVFQIPTEEYGIKLAKRGLIKRAHLHNIAVHYWTINDPDEMTYLIEIGADGIMTDYPHLLKEVYDGYSRREPN